MKKLILVGLTFLTTNLVGQITTTKVAETKETRPQSVYDSLENFLGEDVYNYIGQQLYLKGLSEPLRQYGYEGFVKDYTKSTLANKPNVYKCCDGFNSKYSELAEKYFNVLDVLKHPKAAEDPVLYGNTYFLKLEENQTKNIVYFQYSSKYSSSFPFIVVGYFIKQKQLLVGTEYIVRGENWISSHEPMRDMNTGLPVTEFEAGKKWKCVDITVEEKYYTLSLVLENSKGEKIPLNIDNIKNTHWVFSAEDAEKYREKFGGDNWEKILNGKVKIGMTKEMCELAWGKPKSINNTITAGKTTEQWVYESNYLYFENGLLTTIH